MANQLVHEGHYPSELRCTRHKFMVFVEDGSVQTWLLHSDRHEHILFHIPQLKEKAAETTEATSVILYRTGIQREPAKVVGQAVFEVLTGRE